MKYGESQFRILRRVEQLTKKIQKAKCDLEFLRTCLIYNLTPCFVQIRSLNRPFVSQQQKLEFKRQCLQHEYNNHHKTIQRLEQNLHSALKGLEATFSQVDYFSMTQYLHNTATRTRDQTMIIHQNKLKQLNHGAVGQTISDTQPKLIHNISSYILTDSEERLLNRGWEFCLENRITKFLEFQTDIEENIAKIQSNCHTSIYQKICKNIFAASQQLMKVSRTKRIMNVSDEEVRALKSLKRNSEIIISKADKGNAIVIMNKTDYIERIESILAGAQFKPMPPSTSLEKKEKQMNKLLRELYDSQLIDKSLFWRLHSTSSSLSVLYGQPKVHKAGYPLRPIISSIGSYNYNLSKYLTKVIQNHKIENSPSFIKDSFDFVEKLRHIKTNSSQTMISFDVESLYTNVPVNEAIEIALDLIYKSKKSDTKLSRKQMQQLFQLAVCDVPFRFMHKLYVQQDGVAMGNPLAPILADLFMIKMEEKLKRFTRNKPKIWVRYVDDIFCLFDIDKKNIDIFLQRINKWHLNLKFTCEYEKDLSLPFLDVLVIKERDSLLTTIYRKATHTDLYLLWDSNQCKKYKISLIKTLTIRIQRICSNRLLANKEKERLKQTLINNGYPYHIIRRGIKEGEAIATRLKQPQQTIPTVQKQKIYFTIPYFGQESIILANRIRRTCTKLLPHINLHISFKKQSTLKQNFLPLQKGNELKKREHKLVYLLPCQNCDKIYIGETERKREKRMNEHKAAIRKQDMKSEVAKHILNTQHTMDFTKIETLSKETNWKRRIIKESLLTHHSDGKAINEIKYKLHVFG